MLLQLVQLLLDKMSTLSVTVCLSWPDPASEIGLPAYVHTCLVCLQQSAQLAISLPGHANEVPLGKSRGSQAGG